MAPKIYSVIVENSSNLDILNTPELSSFYCNKEDRPRAAIISPKPCKKNVKFPPSSINSISSKKVVKGRPNKIAAAASKKRWLKIEMPSLKRAPNCKPFCSSTKIIGGPVMNKKFRKKTEKLKNTFLQFKDKIPQYLLTAKAIGTLKQYSGSWSRIQSWCIANGRSYMPLKPEDFTYFLIYLAETGKSYAPCKTSFYATQFMHKINRQKSPLEDNLVHLIMESIKRKFSKAPCRAIPTTGIALKQLFKAVLGDKDIVELMDLRILLCITIQFGILGRSSEVRGLRMKDFRFKTDHMIIRIGKSKTNQFALETSYISIYATGKKFCPVKLTKQYIRRLGYSPNDREAHFLPHIKTVKTASTNSLGQTIEKTSYIVNKGKGLSYNQVGRERKRILAKAGIKNISHKQHGERRGGASELFDKGFSLEKIAKLGRWRSLESVKIYCDMTVAQKKELSKALFNNKIRKGHAF